MVLSAFRLIKSPDKEWHKQQNNPENEEGDFHSRLFRKHIRSDHHEENNDIRSDTIRHRTEFFSMIVSDVEIISSFQQIYSDTKEYSHEKADDI